jgi:ATP-dependent DNA helicase DinG
VSELARRVARSFAAGGPLARADRAFVPRPAQDELAAAVAAALEVRDSLVAEAGTGVGKTFAYLVPLLLAGRRALVSTATKSLQDQLFLRDLPQLVRTLRVPAQLALLKGRASYLCRHRLAQARATAQLPDRAAVAALARVERWAMTTATGDLAEVVGLDERSPVIPIITSTRENCLGTECPEYRACHVVHARREAMAADLVVINHHLFFADLQLRDSGVAELLPSVDAAVFDEAHQLVDAGVQFLGKALGSSLLLDFARDLLAQGLQHARGLQRWQELAGGVERAARELRLALAGPLTQVQAAVKLAWEERAQALPPVLEALEQATTAAAAGAAGVAGVSPDLARLAERAQELAGLARRFGGAPEPGHVRWIEVSAHQARVIESPLHVRDLLGEQRRQAARAWIFVSATLGADDSLSWFTESTGLEDATKLRVASPFDYAAHARRWVPKAFPRPNEAAHPQAVGALAARLAAALGGRTFVLTTTLRVLPQVADALRAQAQAAGVALEPIVQGSEPRRAMLQRYGDGAGKVLIGSQSFWEGIDLRGEALQCVLIDKLPFPPPNDPLVKARVREIEAAGGDAFDRYHVAEAAMSLKQGAGRLIRSETDRGLLVICDPRLLRMGYGARVLAALPPMTPLDDEAQALAWLAELATRTATTAA